MTERRPGSRSRAPKGGAGAVILPILALLLLASIGPGTATPITPLTATLTISTLRANALPSGFWGANVRPYYPLDAGALAEFNATPLNTLRWPGGATGDEYNYTANRIYDDQGTYFVPPTNESEFIQFCRTVSCHAILELPGEIDDPATAAYYVEYTVHTLHFSPEYWEIGNEPALWTHFGIGWTGWTTSQTLNATPGTYAQVVHAYIAAIRAVVPTAQFLGLSGVGTGGYNEATWIRATVALNGPNLSGVAIHVYPAGGAVVTGTPTEAGFLATLSGNGALSARIPNDRSAIRAACPSCGSIKLLVTELGSGTQGGPYSRFMGGFADLVYLAAEVAQAVAFSLPTVDIFAWESTYNGSLLTANGSATRSFGLYSTFLRHLQPEVLSASLAAGPGGVFLTATRNATGTGYSLLVVNANTSAGVVIGLTGSGFPVTGAGTAWTWTASQGGPQSTSWASVLPLLWTVPPASVLLIALN